MVDLRTGDLLDHDPELLMTKMAGAEYRPGTRHPDWTKALEAIPADVRDYLQLRLGQAITGHMPPDDLLVVIQGGGANGKTTIVEATARAAGSYYLLVSHRLLTASPDQHPTVLMDLQGVRYAVAEETPEARRLSVVRLKQTVGTPQISARRIGKDTVTFDAMHSLFVSTNYRPMVEETDHGTWRRLLLIRFPYTFRKSHEPLTGLKDRHGDPGLRLRLATDPAASSTVLAWLVEGARRWYEHQARGVLPEPPAGVVADTRAWQGESDQVLAYITERLRFDPKRHVAVTRPAAGLQRLALRAGPPGVVGADPGLPVRGTRRTIPAGVRKQRFRSTANTEVDVSRPERAFAATAPSQYRAYVGLRFVTRSDLAPDQAEREPVPGNPYAYGSSENPNRRDNPAQLAIPEAAAPPFAPLSSERIVLPEATFVPLPVLAVVR